MPVPAVPLFSLCALLFLCISGATLAAQTTRIVTHDDEEYVGALVSESADTIVIRSASGVVAIVPRQSVRQVDYAYDEQRDLARGYWSFGGAIGTPGIINIVVGRQLNRIFGVRVAAGYARDLFDLEDVYAGVELDLLIRFAGNRKIDHNAVIGIGALDFDAEEWVFAQAGYNLHAYGFHLFGGISIGEGAYDSPQPMVQVGYVHRFP